MVKTQQDSIISGNSLDGDLSLPREQENQTQPLVEDTIENKQLTDNYLATQQQKSLTQPTLFDSTVRTQNEQLVAFVPVGTGSTTGIARNNIVPFSRTPSGQLLQNTAPQAPGATGTPARLDPQFTQIAPGGAFSGPAHEAQLRQNRTAFKQYLDAREQGVDGTLVVNHTPTGLQFSFFTTDQVRSFPTAQEIVNTSDAYLSTKEGSVNDYANRIEQAVKELDKRFDDTTPAQEATVRTQEKKPETSQNQVEQVPQESVEKPSIPKQTPGPEPVRAERTSPTSLERTAQRAREYQLAEQQEIDAKWDQANKNLNQLDALVSGRGSFSISQPPGVPDPTINEVKNGTTSIDYVTAYETIDAAKKRAANEALQHNRAPKGDTLKVSFEWQGVPVTYEGSLKDIQKLYQSGHVSYTDLQGAGIHKRVEQSIAEARRTDRDTNFSIDRSNLSQQYANSLMERINVSSLNEADKQLLTQLANEPHGTMTHQLLVNSVGASTEELSTIAAQYQQLKSLDAELTRADTPESALKALEKLTEEVRKLKQPNPDLDQWLQVSESTQKELEEYLKDTRKDWEERGVHVPGLFGTSDSHDNEGFFPRTKPDPSFEPTEPREPVPNTIEAKKKKKGNQNQSNNSNTGGPDQPENREETGREPTDELAEEMEKELEGTRAEYKNPNQEEILYANSKTLHDRREHYEKQKQEIEQSYKKLQELHKKCDEANRYPEWTDQDYNNHDYRYPELLQELNDTLELIDERAAELESEGKLYPRAISNAMEKQVDSKAVQQELDSATSAEKARLLNDLASHSSAEVRGEALKWMNKNAEWVRANRSDLIASPAFKDLASETPSSDQRLLHRLISEGMSQDIMAILYDARSTPLDAQARTDLYNDMGVANLSREQQEQLFRHSRLAAQDMTREIVDQALKDGLQLPPGVNPQDIELTGSTPKTRGDQEIGRKYNVSVKGKVIGSLEVNLTEKNYTHYNLVFNPSLTYSGQNLRWHTNHNDQANVGPQYRVEAQPEGGSQTVKNDNYLLPSSLNLSPGKTVTFSYTYSQQERTVTIDPDPYVKYDQQGNAYFDQKSLGQAIKDSKRSGDRKRTAQLQGLEAYLQEITHFDYAPPLNQ